MARRSHLSELCSLNGGDLSALAAAGAGEREGWIDDAAVIVALGRGALAVAHASRNLLLLVPLAPAHSSGGFAVVRAAVGPDDGRISALEWVPLGGDDDGGLDSGVALAVGTDAGYLLVYSLAGQLIHKQSIYPAKILRLRYWERKGNSLQDSGHDELAVVFANVIARFDSSNLQSGLHKGLEEAGSRKWNVKHDDMDADLESSFGVIPVQLWSTNKFGSSADAVIVGLMPPPLLELQSSQRYYCAVTIGEDAVVSAYRLSEDRSRSVVGAIISRVVPATFSTIVSVGKMFWRSDQSSHKKPRPKPQPFAKSSPLTCLKDPPRKGEKLTLSPSGTLAAITDSLGRIVLLDTRALVAVRLWKGYRDASCFFIEMLVDRNTRASSSQYEYIKSDYCLCLAIHAPRKGIIEVWQMRTGPRLLTIPCPKGTKVLQPSTRFSTSSTSASYTPLEVFLFNGDSGQLLVLNRHVN